MINLCQYVRLALETVFAFIFVAMLNDYQT